LGFDESERSSNAWTWSDHPALNLPELKVQKVLVPRPDRTAFIIFREHPPSASQRVRGTLRLKLHRFFPILLVPPCRARGYDRFFSPFLWASAVPQAELVSSIFELLVTAPDPLTPVRNRRCWASADSFLRFLPVASVCHFSTAIREDAQAFARRPSVSQPL